MARFIIVTVIISLFLIGGGFLFVETPPRLFFVSLLLLVLSTLGLYRFLVNIKRNKPGYFVPLYLGTLAIKLVAYISYIFVMVKLRPEERFENVVFFMIGYVIFTLQETVFLYRVVNR
ncbi:MAG TPA: hypothetical protein VFM90_04410 [Cyclobacteriaceae bacterium]|nr:hypothetical protein [Cyclobacteriaceae bacterium]